jgi:hypothetical protein
MAAETPICNFGEPARPFDLMGTDGKRYTLEDVRGPKGTLVIFMCNHCPYVKAVVDRRRAAGVARAVIMIVSVYAAGVTVNLDPVWPVFDKPEHLRIVNNWNVAEVSPDLTTVTSGI